MLGVIWQSVVYPSVAIKHIGLSVVYKVSYNLRIAIKHTELSVVLQNVV